MTYIPLYRVCADADCRLCCDRPARPDPMPGAGPPIVRSTAATPAPATKVGKRAAREAANTARIRAEYDAACLRPWPSSRAEFFASVALALGMTTTAVQVHCERRRMYAKVNDSAVKPRRIAP